MVVFVTFFSVFSGKYDNDNGDKGTMLSDILNMFKPNKNQNQYDDDCQEANSMKKPKYDNTNKKGKGKYKYNIHRMLKNSDYNYAMHYKMLKIQMIQAEQDLKIKNNEEYRSRKASLRIHLLKINVISANYTNPIEQEPNLNTYEVAPQFSSEYMKKNYWNALRHQQYLISLKNAYDQYIANLNNAQHMRMLESGLKWMQANCQLSC